MEKAAIMNKYEIVKTLYTDEMQSVYECVSIELKAEKSFIINEYIDPVIIEEMKDSFIYNMDMLKPIETFEDSGRFYAVFPGLFGMPIDEYISKHNLTIADKMYFADGIFKKIIEISGLHSGMQYALCDAKNISVQNRRFFHFNNIYAFQRENLKPEPEDIIKRIGELIVIIFANNIEAEFEKDKDYLPPAILPITGKCIEGGYNSLGKAYADFRNTLIYSTFIDSGSLDKQIRGRVEEAKKKEPSKAPMLIPMILLILLFLGGGFWMIKNRHIVAGPVSNLIGKKGDAPVADFSISVNKIYQNDEVKFIDKSVASKPGEGIKGRLWTIEKNGVILMNSEEETISYVFGDKGEYKISLIAQDTKGTHSKPYTHSITVAEKPEHLNLPDHGIPGEISEEDMK